MANGGWRKPAINEPIHSFPSDPPPAPAHSERVAPIEAYLESKSLDGLCIRWHPVIAERIHPPRSRAIFPCRAIGAKHSRVLRRVQIRGPVYPQFSVPNQDRCFAM
jgi:hypothetical protein